jgi:drug/metabolite transporter (DMT)-like permease
MQTKKLLDWGIFLLLTLIWGSSFILMKYSQYELGSLQVAALRIFSAGIVFLPFAIVHLARLPARKFFTVLLSGVTGNLLPAFLYSIAISRIDSSLASILNSLTPVFVVVIAILFFKDKIKLQKIAGVLLGMTGVCLLCLSKGISFSNFGLAALILLATLSYGINVNMVGHYLKEIHPIHIATISIAFMVIPTGIVLWKEDFLKLAFDDRNVQWALLEASLLGIVGTAIATALFYVLIKRAGGLFASLITYSIPIVGILLGMRDGEQVGALQFVCLGIILTGVYLANK